MKRAVYFSSGAVLFLALVIMWIPWLGETLFYSKGEPREAIVAVSMLQSGDWILPVSCGSDIPYKPPFLAWLIAIFAWIFNGGVVNEFISRLPSAVAAIALVMGGYSWAKKIRGEKFALIMSLVLATSIEFYRAAVACRVDMVLTACMVGAMYMLFEIRARKGKDNFGRYCIVTLLLTAAVLTKGPVGTFLPCLIMGLYCLFRGDRFFPTLGRMAILSLMSCVIPALWYYAAWINGGDSFLQLVWEENFQRLAGTMPYESHVKPFWYNFLTIITGMLPWTLLAIMGLAAWRRFVRQPFKPAGLFAVTAAATVVIFYCIPSSKRSVYLLPAYPFMAYAVASIAEALVETRINSVYARVLSILAIAVPVIVVVSQFYPLMGFSFQPVGWWVYILLALPVIVSVAWQMQAHPGGAAGGAVLIVWAMMTCYGGAVAPAVLNGQCDKDSATELEQMVQNGGHIYTVGFPYNGANTYSLNYYLNDTMRRLPDASCADTVPAGSILVFANPADTVGLPDGYRVSLLTSRLSDTRKPAFFAWREDKPAAGSVTPLSSDSLGTTPCEPAPAARISQE